MILRQLFCVPDCELVSHCDFGDLVLRQGLNDLIVDEQSIYVPELLTRGICGFELHRAPALRILHACEERRLEQFRFVFQFFHRYRPYWASAAQGRRSRRSLASLLRKIIGPTGYPSQYRLFPSRETWPLRCGERKLMSEARPVGAHGSALCCSCADCSIDCFW